MTLLVQYLLGGGTYVSSGLTLGYQEIEKNLASDLENTCLLICDGDVDTGALTLAEGAYNKEIKTSTIAIGEGADTENLKKISQAGDGGSYHVVDAADLTGVFLE